MRANRYLGCNTALGLLLRLNCGPIHIHVLKFPVPGKMTVFGNRTLKEVIKVKQGPAAGPQPIVIGVLRGRDQDTDTEGGPPEDRKSTAKRRGPRLAGNLTVDFELPEL